jgi:hypothetical protein
MTAFALVKFSTMGERNLLLLLLWSLSLAGQTAQTPLPNSELKGPDGQKVQFKFQTLPTSVQIYTCRQTEQGFAWSGPDPDAILINNENALTRDRRGKQPTAAWFEAMANWQNIICRKTKTQFIGWNCRPREQPNNLRT